MFPLSAPSVLLAVIALALISTASNAMAGSAPQEIPPGTVITQQNWREYKSFMSEGLTALFEGSHFWHMPSGLQINVGPTRSSPLPKQYLADTAQYSRSVKLVATGSGGYIPSGYVAGLPFPHPLEGDSTLIGQRIFWDSYYRYQPRVQAAPTYTYSLDSLGNMTQASEVKSVLSQLSYLSDVGLPHTVADSAGNYFVRYSEQIAPEQGKYSTILDLVPADPSRLDELYEYVPNLRRSLRLSQAARCAPVFGSDYLIDDEGDGPPGLPQLFKIDYLGEKKILALEHATPAAFDSPGGPIQLDDRYYYPGSLGIVPFPKPAMGEWELRDSYVISLARLPSASSGYCYSRRIMYVDKENYFGAGELDLYTPQGALFKSQLVFLYPAVIPDSGGDSVELLSGPNVGFLVNFANRHVTVSPGLQPCINSSCVSGGYMDIHRYASPDALMKVVR